MDEKVRQALEQDQTIDITTTGRKSGLPRRIEISFQHLDGRLYISAGTPGRKDWFANLQANPEFMFHLKESVQVDLPARARVIVDEAERRSHGNFWGAAVGNERSIEMKLYEVF
jgi:deazaflavin-dependent oxidoreductase (nitroreductase family)